MSERDIGIDKAKAGEDRTVTVVVTTHEDLETKYTRREGDVHTDENGTQWIWHRNGWVHYDIWKFPRKKARHGMSAHRKHQEKRKRERNARKRGRRSQ